MAETRKLSGILEIVDRASANVSKVSGELDKYRAKTQSLRTVSEAATASGRKLGMAGLAMAAGIGVASKQYMGFDQAMKKAQAVMKASPAQLETMTRYAREMGRDTHLSASQAAAALFELGSMGFDPSQVMAMMKPIIELAGALDAELGPASVTVSAVMKSYGMAAKDTAKVTNIMAAANAASAATFDKLTEGYKYAVPITSMLGTSLESTTALLDMLYDAGLEGSMAGTALCGAFARLLNPTAKVQVIMQKAGITMAEVPELLRDPLKLIRKLEVANLSAADSAALWGRRALVFQTIIRKGSAAYEEARNKVTGTTAATGQYATMMEGARMKLENFLSSLEEFGFSLVQYIFPALLKLLDVGKRVLDWFSSLPGWMRAAIAWAALLTTGILLLGSACFYLKAGWLNALIGLGAFLKIAPAVFAWVLALDLMTLHWVVAIAAAIVGFLLLSDAIATAINMWKSWQYRKEVAAREEKYEKLYEKGYRGTELAEKLGPAVAPPVERKSVMEEIAKYKEALFGLAAEGTELAEKLEPAVTPALRGVEQATTQMTGYPGMQTVNVNIIADSTRQAIRSADQTVTRRNLSWYGPT